MAQFLFNVLPEIDGFEDFEANIRRKLQHASTQQLTEVAKAGANVFVKGAQRRVHVKSGELRDSLHAEVVSANEYVIKTVVTSDKPYMRRLEMGFTGTDSLGRHYNQPPYPYLRPAFDEDQREAVQEMRQYINKMVRA